MTDSGVQQECTYSPENWAHQALLEMDAAEGLVRWASVSMLDVERYKREAGAFWSVVHRLSRERERLEEEIRARGSHHRVAAEPTAD